MARRVSGGKGKVSASGQSTILFREDFASMPLGPISSPRSAFGEYHTPPQPFGAGPWGDAVICTGQQGFTWRVAQDGEQRVFEATQQMARRPAILCLDAFPDLGDYTFSAGFRALSSKRPAGLAFHYHSNRTFFALLWDGLDELLLVRNEHDARQTLARFPAPLDVDAYHELAVRVRGLVATAFLDGREVMSARMSPFHIGRLDGASLTGKVALLAYSPARFAAPTVSLAPKPSTARARRLSSQQRELARLRDENPRPVPVSECSLQDFGQGRSLRLADLDGDGELEFLIAQQSKRANEGDYSQLSCLTAFKPDGRVLWQIGSPVRPTAMLDAPTWDLPVQVADINGDGRLELVLCRDWQLQVRDAATTKLLRSVPTPRSTLGQTVIGWAVEDYYDRICGDSLALCDLQGRGRPGDILIKDRYCNLWAYDSDTLRPLWHVVLNTGHYPLPFDINGDGRDEVLCGFSLISADGEVVWQRRFGDHVDGIGVGHFDPARKDYQVAWVAGEEGFIMVGQDGRTIARHVTGHAQKMSIGRFLPELPGVQFGVITYWGSQGVLSVYDGQGGKLHESEPWHLASAITPVGWRGDGSDFMLLSTHPRDGGMLDGRGRRVVMFPAGCPTLACDAVDIDGCGREEILTWDFDRFVILKAEGKPLGRIPPRYTGPLHNRSNYKANVALPLAVIGRKNVQ